MTAHPPVRAYLALGSNLDPQRHIPLCLQRLRNLPLTSDWQESAWYLTRPWGGIAQPDFINLVVGVTTQHSALDLLAALQQIEHDLARMRELKNGPRTIDIDVLLFGELVLDTPQLQVPHPGCWRGISCCCRCWKLRQQCGIPLISARYRSWSKALRIIKSCHA